MREYNQHGKQELIDEGAVHGSFAMEGLKNLPSQKATLYRGERWTPQEFDQRYRKTKILNNETKTLNNPNITSMSTDREVAFHFALFGDGDVPPHKNTGVFVPGLCTQSAFRALVPSADAGRG